MKKTAKILKSVTFHSIKWDTDGEEVDLPTTITLDVEELDASFKTNPSEAIQEMGADTLSDKYGWCVDHFQFKFNY